MRIILSVVAVSLLMLGTEGLVADAESPAEWVPVAGKWTFAREILPIVYQESETGTALILAPVGTEPVQTEPVREFRAIVKLSADTSEAGLWLDADLQAAGGLQILLGRRSDVGGFALRVANGDTLWEDRFAPWDAYAPYVLEGIARAGKLRVQMFQGSGNVLISQSPWIDLDERNRLTGGRVGLFATEGRARFYRAQQNVEPLSDLVPDPPNKRRLQNQQAAWDIQGDGQWMWKTSKRQCVRQYADCERSSAVCRDVSGTYCVWQCYVRVDQGTQGAGIYFLYRSEEDKGYTAWLGGRYGAGALMLYGYRPTVRSIWSSPQDRWHYETEYLLRAETRDGQVRIQQLTADASTVISDSNWVNVPSETTNEPGLLGLHTWKGPAEFWGFTGEVTPPPTSPEKPTSDALGRPWVTLGDGKWNWSDQQRKKLVQTAACRQAVALEIEKPRTLGNSSCFVRKSSRTPAAGIVFQADRGLANGFLGLMTDDGPRLETLDGKTLWQAAEWTADSNREYRLEGKVMTDRVALKVYDSTDTSRLLIASPDVYVPEANNSRLGYRGVVARGAAEFRP